MGVERRGRWCGGRDSNPRRPEPRDFLPERDLKSRPFDQSRVPPRLFDVRGLLLLSLWFLGGLFFYLGVLFLCWSWARSAVWIARRPPKPEVVGSNPTGPAILIIAVAYSGFFRGFMCPREGGGSGFMGAHYHVSRLLGGCFWACICAPFGMNRS